MSHPKHLLKTAAAVCLALLLTGCVVEPAWGPYHHHHHYEGY